MSNLLTSIAEFCGAHNLPGLRTLYYLPTDWLDEGEYEEYISSNNNFQKIISPSLGGEQWLTLPFFPAGADGWRQQATPSEQGEAYRQEVQGSIQNLRPGVEAVLDQMARHRYLVRLVDRNGTPWLIGRLHEPLRFVCDGETGSRQGGLNGYRFRFEGVTTRRAFGYAPVFPV